MTKWEGSYIWMIAWSSMAILFSIESLIGMPLVLALVVLLIALAGALESRGARSIRFATWGAAALLGLKVATLGEERMNFPLWLLFGLGLIGAIGELFGRFPFKPGRFLHAAAGGIAFAVGGYLTMVLITILGAPISDWPILGDYQFVVKFGLAGLVGGLTAEAIRSIPRPARALHRPGRTMEA